MSWHAQLLGWGRNLKSLICRQLQDCYHLVKFSIEPMAESFPWQHVANGFLGFSSDLLSICKSGANG
jgi:hypothetical protein